MTFGSLLGIVFVFGRRIIPGSNIKKALVLSGIIWLVIFMIPAIKYPANPPTVGDPDTIHYRQYLFISFILISGFTALGLSIIYTKINLESSIKITYSFYYLYNNNDRSLHSYLLQILMR